MSERRAELLKRMEAPPGGWARLEARLEERPGWGSPTVRFAVVAVSVATVLLFAQSPRPTVYRPEHPWLEQLGLEAALPEPVVLSPSERGRAAVSRVGVEASDVLFYRVETLPDPGETDR